MSAPVFSVIEIDAHGDAWRWIGKEAAGRVDGDDLVGLRIVESAGQGLGVLSRGYLDDPSSRGYPIILSGDVLRADWRNLIGLPDSSVATRAIIIRFEKQWWNGAMLALDEAFGLSTLESNLARELAEFGDFEDATLKLGVGRVSARNALARLRGKFGARNVPELVNHILALIAKPAGPHSVRTDELLADMLGLSSRQFSILSRLADGEPRKRVADETGHSMPTVKAVLSTIYTRLAIESAGELSSLLGHARLFAEMLASADGLHQVAQQSRMDRTVVGRDRRQVGYSLFGSGEGPVVLFMHSQNSCRHPPTRLVNMLKQRNCRVLCIDRPGFGDTASAPSSDIDAQVRCAVADARLVLDHEGIGKVTLLSRAAGQMAIALKHGLGDAVDHAVIVNPAPAVAHTPVDRGPLGAVKRRFASNPMAIRAMIGVLLRLSSPDRLLQAMRRSMVTSPPDFASLDDVVMREDFLASTANLADNLDGYVVENVSWARGWDPKPRFRGEDWTILYGRHNLFHDSGLACDYYRKILPSAKVRIVPECGQMMLYSHPEEVLRELDAAVGARGA